MTPFDSWYATNVASQLPADYPPHLAKAGKEQAAQVWNAALDAALEEESMYDDTPHVSGVFVNANYIEMLKTDPSSEASAIHEARGKS